MPLWIKRFLLGCSVLIALALLYLSMPSWSYPIYKVVCGNEPIIGTRAFLYGEKNYYVPGTKDYEVYASTDWFFSRPKYFCSSSAAEKKGYSRSSSLQDEQAYKQATSGNDLRACEKILDQLDRYICIREIAVQNRDATICSSLETDDLRADCRKDVEKAP